MYDLTTLKAPKSAGALLRTLAAVAEGRMGAMLAGKFFTDLGVTAFRAVQIAEPPPAEHPLLSAARSAGHPAGEGAPTVPDAGPSEGDGDFPFETAAAFTRAYAAGTATPTAVAEKVLAATEASDGTDPALRAIIAQQADEVRALAAASTARWQAGAPLGPLDGVPVAVKDELDQRGYPTTVGTTFLANGPAAEDATVVARLRAAGAVLIGKANMHEIGIGVTGINPHHGAARNPYDPARVTGGSSSGSAAAVGAGLCPLAVGADGGGSIRIPAALCGVVGLKATFGRISEHGAFPLCWSVAHVGPLAASVRDVALGYALMAGRDAHDANTAAQPPVEIPDLSAPDLRGQRLGVYRPWFEHAQPAVVAACDAAVARLVARGAEVVEIEVPHLALARVAHMITITSEMVASMRPHLAEHQKALGADTRLNLALAGRLTGSDYVHAQRVRQHFWDRFEGLFERCDAVLTPTTACTAPPIPAAALASGASDLETMDQIMRYAPLGNLLGLPALTVPCGYDADGLPVGLQLMGRAWDEARLLTLGAAVEADAPRRAPAVAHRLLA